MNSSSKVRLSALCVAASLAAISSAASAGFLDDFYDNSNYQGNLTKPGVIESNTLNTITGGGFVYKVPRNQFNPFYLSPPSLKAGCGGIDIFTGAFSLPSSDEFMAFLRNIGQSLPGLAFELALQSLSPELAQYVAEYKNQLMRLAQNSTDACQAASALLDVTGAAQKIKQTVHEAENYGRSIGLFSDAYASKKEVGTHGQKAIDTVPVKYNAEGEIVDGPEVNVVWAMLNNTKMNVVAPKELKEIMMSVVGSWIYVKDGAGESQRLQAKPLAPLMHKFTEYIGTVDSPTLDPLRVSVYKCEIADPTCLNPNKDVFTDTAFAYRVYKAANDYRKAILTRNPALIDQDQLYMIASSSSIPLLRIVNATAYHRFTAYSEGLIAVYAEAVAYEMFLNYVQSLSYDIEEAVSNAKTNTNSSLIVKHADELLARLKAIREMSLAESANVYAKVNTASAFITQVQHIEQSLRGNIAADLAANMAFSGRR